MKAVNGLSKVLCALGVSTLLLTGVAGAQSVVNAKAQPGMQSQWDGVGSVASDEQTGQVDYIGATTVFKRYYPNAVITSISYDAKHNPTYEIEAQDSYREIELKIDEATGQIASHTESQRDTRKSLNKLRTFNPQNTILPEVAETKAIERVGSEFQTMEWELKVDGKRVVYELEMTNGGNKEADVKVDATTGKVLSAKVKNTKY